MASWHEPANPYQKAQQLARGTAGRYRRKVVGGRGWERIRAEKGGPCRVCGGAGEALHHLVARDHFGDDVADNMVPVCRSCHSLLHRRNDRAGKFLLAGLSDAEYAYMIERGGEDYPERAYGIRYSR